MIIVLGKNNYYVDESTDDAKDNLYVTDEVFNDILASSDLRDTIRIQLLTDTDCVQIGRVGSDIANGQVYAKKDFGNSKTEDEVSTKYSIRKELGYYAKL